MTCRKGLTLAVEGLLWRQISHHTISTSLHRGFLLSRQDAVSGGCSPRRRRFFLGECICGTLIIGAWCMRRLILIHLRPFRVILAGLLLMAAVRCFADAGGIPLQWEPATSANTYTVWHWSGLTEQWSPVGLTTGTRFNTGGIDGYVNLFCVSRTSVSGNAAEFCKSGVFVDER